MQAAQAAPTAPAGLLATPSRLAAELRRRERRLTLFAALLLALLVPMALLWGLDHRVLRGANVWVKPMKFALSIAVMALTTAWFVGHLPRTRRRGPAVAFVVWLVVAAGSFELGYISLQAALGQASHYNGSDALHAALYGLMGVGAMLLSTTQLLLAWQLVRHPDPRRPAAYRLAVLLGLVMTSVLGAGVGGLLSGMQPRSGGAVLPLLGWSLAGGDLRPAHFVGIHAAQALPLAGWLASRAMARPTTSYAAVWAFALAYITLFAALVAWGVAGRA